MAPTRRKKDSQESYIYLQARGGLNDCLNQLAICTTYAIKHRYSIILEMTVYKTDLDSIFDFSAYPVKIYTDVKQKKEELQGRPVEPAYMKHIQHNTKRIRQKNGTWRGNHGRPLTFNLSKTYPRDIVLIYSAGGGGKPVVENATKRKHLFEYIRFTDSVLDEYYRVKDAAKIPERYSAIHLRATDMKLQISPDIVGASETEQKAINELQSPDNSHTEALDKVSAFIAMNPGMPVYIASDNVRLLEKLKAQHKGIVTTYSEKNTTDCESNRDCKRIHAYNSNNSTVLRGALIDLLLLANAKKLMTSAGGFSRLAAALSQKKELLKRILRR